MHQIILLIGSLIMLITMISIGSPLGIFTTLLIFLTILTLALVSFASWKNRGISTLWLIATSIKNNLPLPDLIDAQASEYRGNRGRRLLELSDQLREGIALPIAIDHYRSLVPSQGQLAIRVGGETGTLGESLNVTARHLDRSRDPEQYSYYYLIFYLTFVVLFILSVTCFLLYFIVPKYFQIFSGFGLELPSITLFLVKLANWSSDFLVLLILMVSFVVGVICESIYIRYRSSSIRREDTFYTFKLIDRMLSRPFTFSAQVILSFFPNRSTPEILRLLSVSAEAGKPLVATVDSLSRHFPFPDIRKRMIKVRLSVEQGTEFWQAMSQQKIVTLHQAALFRGAERSNQLGFMLRETSKTMDTLRFNSRSNSWEIGRCVLLVILSILVAFIAIGLFYPIINLINELA